MEKPISVKVKFCIEDPIRVARFHQNQSFIFRYDAALTGSIVFLGFAVAIVGMANDLHEINVLGLALFSAIPATIAALAVCVLRGLISPWLARRRVTKYFKSSPLMNDESVIEFSERGIKSTGNLSSSFVKWEAVVKAVESKTDLMFYTSASFPGLYIAKNAFNSDADLDSVKALLRQTLDEKALLLRLDTA